LTKQHDKVYKFFTPPPKWKKIEIKTKIFFDINKRIDYYQIDMSNPLEGEILAIPRPENVYDGSLLVLIGSIKDPTEYERYVIVDLLSLQDPIIKPTPDNIEVAWRIIHRGYMMCKNRKLFNN
jgi:hypothetical protein